MKILSLIAFVLCCMLANAQYFYNDIIGTSAITDRAKIFFASKVKSVTATGFDAAGAKTADFNEWQEWDDAAALLKVTTRNGQTVSRQWYQFDGAGKLVTLTDSTTDIRSITSYSYDASGRLSRLSTVTTDTTDGFTSTDVHQYIYGSAGTPERLWRIVNGKDSSEYRFSTDDQGNVSAEQLFRRNVGLDQVYYYYDEAKRLTDIVRFDKKTKKLLPDFMFEYDEQNRVIQKITTLSTATRNYLIWRYAYNAAGIKTREALYNKQKELTGKIDYAIVYGK